MALEMVRKNGEIPSVARLATETGQRLSSVALEFASETLLAEACLDQLCRHAVELHQLADSTVGIARWTLRGLLGWLESLVEDYGPLVRAAPHAKVWEELRSSIDMILLSATDQLDGAKRKEIANKLVSAVVCGSEWEPSLTMLLDVLDPQPAASRQNAPVAAGQNVSEPANYAAARTRLLA
jgi:hypothetical protein